MYCVKTLHLYTISIALKTSTTIYAFLIRVSSAFERQIMHSISLALSY